MPKMRPRVELPTSIEAAAAHWIARRDAGLSAAEQGQLKQWLEADVRHKTALAWYTAPWAALDRPVRAGVANVVIEQIEALERRQHRLRVGSLATVLAILLIGLGFWQFPVRTAQLGERFSRTAKLILPTRQVLADGTTVDLKEGAEIEVHYTATLRGVVLRRGEALFEVTKNLAKPFVVTANGVEFRAVGTAFSVGVDSKEVELLVTEGRVAVDRVSEHRLEGRPNLPRGIASGPETIAMVDAGSRLVILSKGENENVPKPAPLSASEINERLSWQAPRLEFTGTSLVDAVEILNVQLAHRGHIRLVIEDPNIEQVKISGLFRADNTDALIDLLAAGFDIRATRRGESEIVLRRAN